MSTIGPLHLKYTMQDVIGDVVLSDWARWVAIDSGGEVWEYEKKPAPDERGFWVGGACNRTGYITKIVPPFNFKAWIWEIES